MVWWAEFPPFLDDLLRDNSVRPVFENPLSLLLTNSAYEIRKCAKGGILTEIMPCVNEFGDLFERQEWPINA